MKTLPNLQHIDFRAIHVEQTRYMVPIRDSLFAGNLPCLEKFKYLGVTRGLAMTAKNLTSCEIGGWSESAGPAIFYPDVLQALFNNNRTVKSLMINECEFMSYPPGVPAATPMTDLKFLRIECHYCRHFEGILSLIHAPQFRNLDTLRLSLPLPTIEADATDNSGHTLQFSLYSDHGQISHPLQHFGVVITTLRLDQGIAVKRIDDAPGACEFFRSLDAVQVLEFNGTIADLVQNVLSVTGVFPGLKVIRVAVSPDVCKRTFRHLATATERRMEEGNPLTTIEPLLAEGEGGLDQNLRVEWEESYKAEGLENFLSK